jgi:hypothetical protein
MRMSTKIGGRTLGAIVVALVLVLGIAWFVARPGSAPAGQLAIATLDAPALDALRADFNRDSNHTRLIVLLSPT